MTFKVNPYDADYTEHMPWMLNFQKIEEKYQFFCTCLVFRHAFSLSFDSMFSSLLYKLAEIWKFECVSVRSSKDQDSVFKQILKIFSVRKSPHIY